MLARLVELVLVPSRPWYRWFPSDYLGDTAHLTIEEDCLYRRLLDLHWKLGHLPADEQMLARLARFPQDKFDAAWQQVRPFFKDPGGRTKKLVNARMQRLVADCHYKIEQKRDAAKARWNKKIHAPAMQTQSDPDPEARSMIQKQEEDLSQESVFGSSSLLHQVAPPKKQRDRTRATGTRIPPGWEPSDMAKSWAANNVDLALDLKRELERFRDYWSARPGAGGRKVDWEATWRNWLRKADEDLAKRQPQGGNGDGRRETRYDRDMRAIYEANMTGADDDELERERPHRLLGDDA